jgi:hypothetical protein
MIQKTLMPVILKTNSHLTEPLRGGKEYSSEGIRFSMHNLDAVEALRVGPRGIENGHFDAGAGNDRAEVCPLRRIERRCPLKLVRVVVFRRP